ncbi:MAG: DUF4157 domain-containing protein [Oceanibaculum sp.]
MRCSVIQGRFRAGAVPGSVIQRHGGGEAFQVPAAMAARLGMAAGGQPLPPTIQRHMEGVLGVPLGDVRVRVGPEASALGAVAFTMGSTIHFAPGRYDPGSRQGLQLLGHELAHVVQQRQGRVANPFGSGIAVVSDRALEAQADAIGIKAAMAAGAAPPVQMKARMQAGPMPMRPGAAGGGQVAQPFLGALAGYAMPALSYVGSTIAAHPYIATAIGAGILYDQFKSYIWGSTKLNTLLGLSDPAAYKLTIISWHGDASTFAAMHENARMSWQKRPRDGGDRLTSKDILVKSAMNLGMFTVLGHVSVELADMTGKVIFIKGYWPDGVKDDASKYADASSTRETFHISQKQAVSLLAAIDKSEKAPARFAWTGYGGDSCASWALKMMRAAGVSGGTFFDRYMLSLPKLVAWTGGKQPGHAHAL